MGAVDAQQIPFEPNPTQAMAADALMVGQGSATFVLEDDNGAVACKVTFSNGFNPTSRAHQAAQMLVQMMDGLCNNLGPIPQSAMTIEAPSLIVVEGDRARKA